MLEVLLGDPTASAASIVRGWQATKQPYCSGLDIKASQVFNICPGKVIACGASPDRTYAATILVNESQVIRYTHLSSCDVSLNQIVDIHDIIGRALEFVHFEYCETDAAFKRWAVRVGPYTAYKQDPTGLLNGSLQLRAQPLTNPEKDIHAR